MSVRDKVDEMCMRHAMALEAEVRRLLCGWASELEPRLIYEQGPHGQRFIGIGIAGMPIGSRKFVVIPSEAGL